jgi:hypothetical protein
VVVSKTAHPEVCRSGGSFLSITVQKAYKIGKKSALHGRSNSGSSRDHACMIAVRLRQVVELR